MLAAVLPSPLLAQADSSVPLHWTQKELQVTQAVLLPAVSQQERSGGGSATKFPLGPAQPNHRQSCSSSPQSHVYRQPGMSAGGFSFSFGNHIPWESWQN